MAHQDPLDSTIADPDHAKDGAAFPNPDHALATEALAPEDTAMKELAGAVTEARRNVRLKPGKRRYILMAIFSIPAIVIGGIVAFDELRHGEKPFGGLLFIVAGYVITQAAFSRY